MNEAHHPFRSKEAKETYLAHYDELAKRWPIASEDKLVETSFGQTFVRVGGPGDGPPLVLLPGDSENSLAWIPLIAALSADYRTFALDHIFDNGRSIYTRPMKKPSDFVQWLEELFTALELNDINLMGHSYGGWQASLYALAHPQRLEKLILLAPAATVLPPPLGLVARAMLYYFIPIRFVTKRYLYWYAPDSVQKEETRQTIDEMVNGQLLARRCFKGRKFVAPTVLADQDWQRLQVPTLFLIGENEVTYSAHKALRRLATVAPHVETVITPDADHHLPIVKPEWVSYEVVKFLTNQYDDKG
jgi:pimeloyl-ACP methyl ester carboxylesterase